MNFVTTTTQTRPSQAVAMMSLKEQMLAMQLLQTKQIDVLQAMEVSFYSILKHHANILEGRCRKGSNGGDSTLLSSKEVTMATEPQSTSQAPVNTSLRETSVWSIDTYPKIWEGGREKKQASKKATQAKAHGNAPANLPGTPQVSQATPLHWLGFNFA